MPVKLIVFDMAGTTVHDQSNVGKAFLHALHSFDYHQIQEEEVQVVMGYKKPVAIRKLLEKT